MSRDAIQTLISELRCEPCISSVDPDTAGDCDAAAAAGSTMSREDVARVCRYLESAAAECPSWDTYRRTLGNSETYTRHLLACETGFSLLLLVWRPGHATPVHEHRCGVWSFVRVLGGELVVRRCGGEEGGAAADDVRCVGVGDGVEVLCPRTGLHEVRNDSDEVCLSLHLYTPPMLECCVARGAKGSSLAGSPMSSPTLPVSDDDGPASPELGAAGADGRESPEVLPVVYGPSGASADTGSRFGLLKRGVSDVPLYPNFQTLTSILQSELEGTEGAAGHSEAHIEYIKSLLGAMRFNPDEWLQYSKFINQRYTRNLVGHSDKFTILILCWERGQESPVHDHAGSSCWVKVLEGDLTETRYAMPTEEDIREGRPLRVEEEITVGPEGVAYINDFQALHKMGNKSSSQRVVSLHIYVPAFSHCHIYDLDTAAQRRVPVTSNSGLYHAFMNREAPASLTAGGEIAPTTDLQQLLAAIEHSFDVAEANNRTPGGDLQALLDNFVLRPEEWRKFVHFSDHRYIRVLLGHSERFTLFLLCWNMNQSTPPHTHGDSTSDPRVWIKVLEGVFALTRFPGGDPTDEDDARVRLLNSSTPATCFDGRIGLHKSSNPSSEHTMVSLHLYEGKYMSCVSACKKVRVPVSYCNPVTGVCESPTEDVSVALSCDDIVFETVAKFTEVMRSELCTVVCAGDGVVEYRAKPRGEVDTDRVKRILERVSLNPSEVDTYAVPAESGSYTRTLIAFGQGFSVYIMCLGKGHISEAHSHGNSLGWLKVLRGRVHETRFAVDSDDGEAYEDSTKVLKEGTVVEMESKLIHRLKNPFAEMAYTLNVYTPQLTSEEVFFTDPRTAIPTEPSTA